ncbi:MAG: DUF1501 domain-containing protein, partial [Myxococcales bacterium]
GSMLLGNLPFRAFADAAKLAPPDRCFVFAYFSGGWDQLLSLDPRDPAVFTVDRLAETRILPAYDLIGDASYPTTVVTPPRRSGGPESNITFGPAIGRLANHYDLMAVVRGINMTTLGHDEGFRYFLTGKRPIGAAARGSSTATEIVGQMAPTVPIPSLAYRIETYNDRYPGTANALRVSNNNDLLLTLAASRTQLDSEIEKQLVDFRGDKVACEAQLYDRRGLVSAYEGARSQMREVLDQRLDNVFRFERPEDEAVRQQYGLPANGPYDTPAGRAAMIATALKRGISQCVSINIAGGLDTHFGTQRTQADNQRAGFNALGDLVDDLRKTPHPTGGNFMDHTTILIFSEFSRTPMLNGQGGRDHHISGSCAILGKGVKHNVVFGRSGDIAMAPGVIDFKTGMPAPGGRNILPENVVATILASAGLDYSILREDPLHALLA